MQLVCYNDFMNNFESVNLIMQVTGTLSNFPRNLRSEELEMEMWAHINSKYSNAFKLKVMQEQTLSDGMACMANIGEKASITFFDMHKKYYEVPSLKDIYNNEQTFDIGPNDVIMFPTHIKHKIEGDGAKVLIFQVTNKENFGNGENKYRVEVVFSDKYYIDINANSEEEAKNIAYDINTSYWIHEWPKDKDLEKTQVTRISKWGKKNLRSFKLD
jgi:hypothetical protein